MELIIMNELLLKTNEIVLGELSERGSERRKSEHQKVRMSKVLLG